ncbi:hypothetical protein G7046_g3788 [Stylonectria norvegica]|nr:hypothetical protein G7046_g3788 [Stylonectria norvegica]
MSKFTRLYLRVPRPQTLFGCISLQTGTELISLALVFNKVTGVYGLLAILTGYQLSLLQLSTYIYSIGVLVPLALLIPHIRRQSPWECLALAWLYILDTAVNAAYAAAFGLDWYFASQGTPSLETQATSLPSIVADGMDGLRRETALHGKVVPQETATSMLLIVGATLIRVYFSFVAMAYAKQVLQKYMQLMILEGPGTDDFDGPFAIDLPDGEGRKGRLGRLMVSFGRGYWIDQRDEEWERSMNGNKSGSVGTLSGEASDGPYCVSHVSDAPAGAWNPGTIPGEERRVGRSGEAASAAKAATFAVLRDGAKLWRRAHDVNVGSSVATAGSRQNDWATPAPVVQIPGASFVIWGRWPVAVRGLPAVQRPPRLQGFQGPRRPREQQPQVEGLGGLGAPLIDHAIQHHDAKIAVQHAEAVRPRVRCVLCGGKFSRLWVLAWGRRPDPLLRARFQIPYNTKNPPLKRSSEENGFPLQQQQFVARRRPRRQDGHFFAASDSLPRGGWYVIAYLSSDVIVSVQPSLGAESDFSAHLKRYAGRKDRGLVAQSADAIPQILSVRHNTDPLLSVFTPIRSGKLVSVTTTSTILLPSISHLYKLANYPVVLHVSLQPRTFADYSVITSIRNTGWTFLHSETLQEAQDMALTAHALAVRTGKGVIHFFAASTSVDDDPIAVEDAGVVREVLDIESVRRFQAGPLPASASGIYADDGHVAVSSDHDPAVNGTSEQVGALAVPASADASKVPSTGTSVKSSHDSSSSTPAAPSSVATTVEGAPPQVTSEDIYKCATRIWAQLKASAGRDYSAFEYSGPANAENCLFIFGSDAASFAEAIDAAKPDDIFANAAILTPRLYRPWIGTNLVEAVPKSVKRIAVLEQIHRKTTKWGPLLIDVLTSIKSGPGGVQTIVGYQLGYIAPETVTQALRGVLQNLIGEKPIQNLEVGKKSAYKEPTGYELETPKLETAYTKILDQLFGKRTYIANAIKSKTTGLSATVAATPEFGFGSLLARKERRKQFVAEVKEAATNGSFTTEGPKSWLARWAMNADDTAKSTEIADDVIARLETDGSSQAQKLLSAQGLFRKESLWLTGSDAWAYDLGNSGVHHVLASGENVNMLIIDSTPYSEKATEDANRRKKDIGLYAMNFGNVYVASTAVYSSYTQVLQAMLEADKFDGPSVVLAYLPYFGETDSPLTVLQETKKAVDAGYWPLYRWNPDNEKKGEPAFSLDSELIKQELKKFLARDNQLTQLMNKEPKFAAALAQDFGSEVRTQQKRKAKDAYAQLLEGLLGAPLTILFASDNGNAGTIAKRLASRGRARGLKTSVMAMEDYPIEDLPSEENIVFISSTAGQGEFPQNGIPFWDVVKDNTSLDLASVNYSVFGLGDSHYWPRKEDRIYYNKPAKDLDRVLTNLGAKHLADTGLGDDQDPDGFQTGYQEWEPKIWQALGVDKVDGLPEEPPPITNEDIKLASNYLRGTIVEGLNDPTTGAISANDGQLTKFHGTYMQDDRDVRDERKAQGLEPAYSFMIRCRLPGGISTPKQWVQMDDIANELGNETMKLTTRQTFQFHGIVKGKLKPAMQAINRALMTTIAACGDVNRNVMCSSLPTHSDFHRQVFAYSQKISDHLLPSTSAYHEIWLQEDDKKTQVAGDAVQDFEPLYGPTYLPRKFKITIAIPPHNDTDVYAHDIGLIAIKGKDGNLEGFNMLVGGGMGATHNNKKTYPQTGRMFGFVKPEDIHIACEKVMLIQRDHGDRKNRKHARLKYTLDDMTVPVFKSKVEELWGNTFDKERPFEFKSNVDTFGWQKDEKGLNHFTFFIENGRIEDTPEFQMKTGLREIAKVLNGEFRLTGNQHLILSNVTDEDLPAMKKLMKQYKLDNVQFSALRLSSSACVAFPTCGLAMAESERYLPVLITKLEDCLEENGLRQDSIVMRMTGCPNGCARPWLAEVAFVGKAFGAYNMYLGGGYHGQRLNKLYRQSIKEEEILVTMKALLKQYALERLDGERFGDFCIRAGIIVATTDGQNFHADVHDEESDEE